MSDFEVYLAARLAEPTMTVDVASRVRNHVRRRSRRRTVAAIGAIVAVVALTGLALTVVFDVAREVMPAIDARAGVDSLLWLPVVAIATLFALVARDIVRALVGTRPPPEPSRAEVALSGLGALERVQADLNGGTK